MTVTSNLAEAPVSALEAARASRDSRPLRLITCGSVDDGKSTLIGRLLWDTKAVKEDQAATLQRDSTGKQNDLCLLYTSPSPRDRQKSRMPSSA